MNLEFIRKLLQNNGTLRNVCCDDNKYVITDLLLREDKIYLEQYGFFEKYELKKYNLVHNLLKYKNKTVLYCEDNNQELCVEFIDFEKPIPKFNQDKGVEYLINKNLDELTFWCSDNKLSLSSYILYHNNVMNTLSEKKLDKLSEYLEITTIQFSVDIENIYGKQCKILSDTGFNYVEKLESYDDLLLCVLLNQIRNKDSNYVYAIFNDKDVDKIDYIIEASNGKIIIETGKDAEYIYI